MSKTTVITGAAGFIGSNTVAELNRRGHTDLLLVDTLGTDEKWRNLCGLRFEDLLPPAEFLRRVEADTLPEIGGIVHLGACSSTTERDADYLLENNYRYTRTLCEWSQRRGARFVYASSAATYGAGEQGYSDDDRITPALQPLNMYGYSKHLFDLWALRHNLFAQGTRSIAGLKYFNVFGPREEHKGGMRSMVTKAVEQIGRTGRVALFKSHQPEYGDGEQRRDFLYVRDAVDVTLWLLAHPAAGGLFNCGTGVARTWNDLASAVFQAMGKPVSIDYIDMPEPLRGKYQSYTEADMRKLHAAGYAAAFHTLEQGVADCVRYLLPGHGADAAPPRDHPSQGASPDTSPAQHPQP